MRNQNILAPSISNAVVALDGLCFYLNLSAPGAMRARAYIALVAGRYITLCGRMIDKLAARALTCIARDDACVSIGREAEVIARRVPFVLNFHIAALSVLALTLWMFGQKLQRYSVHFLGAAGQAAVVERR